MSKLEQLEQVESIKLNPKKTNRLIYLDFLRGFFIIYVLLVHSVTNVVFKTDTGAINDIKPQIMAVAKTTPITVIAVRPRFLLRLRKDNLENRLIFLTPHLE